MSEYLNGVLNALRELKREIHLCQYPKFKAGSKKSQSWLRKLSTIEGDIVAETSREKVLSEANTGKKKEVG